MPGKLSLLAFRSGELLSYSAGVLLAGFFVVQLAQGEVQRQDGIAEFEQMAQASGAAQGNEQTNATAEGAQDFENTGEPDTSLWAPGRLADYQASLKADLPPVLGVLEVPSVGLKVPVYSTNTDLVMDRGAGIIDGMAYPHEPGNIGISGHRDGYFRVLKDVQVGDTIVLQSTEGEKRFKINATKVVAISDTTLLRDTDDQTVTLVTCYPFYFVGHAPKRFIVTASLDTPNVNQN
jgi:LPXTG-site transpeptidase (sortase) family protein